ncbi:MAG: hypothetical protein DRJ67_03695 [Thermoprotei archaeon]|nr:MAG: hypothetical protein DRJ67_03695 [Thermoprotei archaeon]
MAERLLEELVRMVAESPGNFWCGRARKIRWLLKLPSPLQARMILDVAERDDEFVDRLSARYGVEIRVERVAKNGKPLRRLVVLKRA